MTAVERRVRGIALAAFSGLLTAVGHLAGGGTLGDLGLLVVLLPLLAGLFVSLAARSRGPLGSVAVLGAGQLVLHYLMVLLHPAQSAEGLLAGPSSSAEGLFAGPSSSAVPALLGGPSMLLMHAAVTLISAVGLRHADAAVVTVARALRRIVPRRITPLLADRPLPALAVPGPGVSARLARVLLSAHARRGPPVGC
jgi:hypothetical protein